MRRESRRRAARRRRRAAGIVVTGAAIGAAAVPSGASAVTFTVTNTNDAGPGSLRQAVLDGNMTTPSDTIEFAPGVSGTINLASTIVVTRSTIIDGPGSDKLRVVNPTSVAFFQNDTLPSGINVSFEGLTVEGHSSGPGSAGGAFRLGSGASTIIRNCAMTGTAANQGGAIFISDIPAVSVIDSTITGATAGSLGGGIYSRDAGLVVSGSTLSGNKGSGGGAIDVENPSAIRPASLAVVDSKITGNQATTGDGGAIEVSSADGPTSIVRSTVSGNFAPVGDGGGVYFGYASSLGVDSSTFSGNTAQNGAGMFVYAPSGATAISDSTIASNVTTGKGGGIYSFGYYDKPFRVQNSTIASNSAGAGGGGVFRFGYDGTGPGYEGPEVISLSSTIVANNQGGDFAQGPLASPSGSFSLDHSIVSTTVGGATITEAPAGTNKLNTGPVSLGPLADNSGPTQTMLPALDGPAIDAGTANSLTTDQRGLARSFDQSATANASGSDGTDIGAVEVGDSTVDGAALKIKRKQKQKGRKVVVAIGVSASEPATASGAGSVKLGKKKLPLASGSVEVPGGETVTTLKLKPSGKKAARKIARALAKGKGAKATLQVTFTDAAGNAETIDGGSKLVAKKRKK